MYRTSLTNCHLKADTNDLLAIQRFKETVTAQLEKCFIFDCKNIAILSAVVDPGYHDLDLLRSEQREEVASRENRKNGKGMSAS